MTVLWAMDVFLLKQLYIQDMKTVFFIQEKKIVKTWYEMLQVPKGYWERSKRVCSSKPIINEMHNR